MRGVAIIILLLCFVYGKAQQQQTIDSLRNIVSHAADNKQRVRALCRLSHIFVNIDAQRAYRYGQNALSLAGKTNDAQGEITALNQLSVIDRNEGRYSKALSKLKDALIIAEAIPDSVAMAKTYISIGDIYWGLQNLDKAIDNYEKAYELNNIAHNLDIEISSLERIGNRYMDKGGVLHDTIYFFKAIEIYKTVRRITKEKKSNQYYVSNYVALADAYNILGKTTSNNTYLYTSLKYSDTSLRAALELDMDSHIAISYLNFGEANASLKNYETAISDFKEAEKIYTSLGDKAWLHNTHALIGKTYYAMNRYDKAIEHMKKAIDYATAQHLSTSLQDSYSLLAEMHSKQNKHKEAYYYQRLYMATKDSMMNENSALAIARMQTELDMERKDNDIEFFKKNAALHEKELENKNTERNYLVAGIIFSVLAAFFTLYLYRAKQKSTAAIIKAKELAERARETQEQFLANTSHEIRTPMNGIIGMTNQLIGSPLNEKQKIYVNAIRESSDTLLLLINELLDLSKITAKKLEFEHKPFRLRETLANLVYLLELRAVEKGVRLQQFVDDTVPELLVGDAARLKQVLLNLAENAIKFTHKGEVIIRVITTGSDAEKAHLLFSVEDTGIGIPKDKQNRIFETFTQVNAKTTRKYGGTGLGLAICKQLVEQQGGSISVKSELNKGSVFSFTLSFGKMIPGGEVVPSGMPAALPEVDLNKLSILVVDDNKINQQVAYYTLQKWNAHVSIADNAQDAFDLLEQGNFDMVLMDVTMPDIDGFEATRYIRQKMKPPVCNIPVIANTASAFEGDREKCLQAGMNDYISKPFKPEELLQKILGLRIDKSNRITDLKMLYNRAEGDREFLKEMLDCYIKEMTGYISEMDVLVEQKDVPGISRQAHKMKSPVALMGAYSLKDLYQEIERETATGTGDEKVIGKISQAKTLCLQTVEEIRTELDKYS